ncbi:hypothetical protein PVL29_025078 [Vitis rotundifolia]|uniref:Uncharacterized protein n=1 Tax=Vitis rotundifolia TaxID=103349 RepID=A0AA39DAK4_VITRO|nr:hypothetical protein PVL29_025078 [Vitis rotundifolia]
MEEYHKRIENKSKRDFRKSQEQLQSLENSTMTERFDKSEGWNERNEHAVENPEEVASMVDMSIRNSTKMRNLDYFSCGTGNPIDDCWHCDPH